MYINFQTKMLSGRGVMLLIPLNGRITKVTGLLTFGFRFLQEIHVTNAEGDAKITKDSS